MEKQTIVIENGGQGLTFDIISNALDDRHIPHHVTSVRIDYLAVLSYPFCVSLEEDDPVHGKITDIAVMCDDMDFSVAYVAADPKIKHQYNHFVPRLIKQVTINF